MERKPEIVFLCDKIEEKAGGVLKSPAGFDELATKILKETHKNVSVSTLKRIFGYVKADNNYQTAVLDTLAVYAGFPNFDVFCKTHDGNSGVVNSKTLRTSDLNIGDKLRLSWFPDRIVTLEYLGEQNFIIEKSVNSKLKDGVTFKCNMFIIGEPVYFYEIDGVKDSDYKAARQGGLSSCDVIK